VAQGRQRPRDRRVRSLTRPPVELRIARARARVTGGAAREAPSCRLLQFGIAERWKCTIFQSSPRLPSTKLTRPAALIGVPSRTALTVSRPTTRTAVSDTAITSAELSFAPRGRFVSCHEPQRVETGHGGCPAGMTPPHAGKPARSCAARAHIFFASATSWSRALPQPSWKPMAACFLAPSSSPWIAIAVYLVPAPCGSSRITAVNSTAPGAICGR
jgi:hypothetical protein